MHQNNVIPLISEQLIMIAVKEKEQSLVINTFHIVRKMVAYVT